MKQTLLLLLFFASLHTTAQQGVSFGVKGGVNVADFRSEGLAFGEFEPKISYHVGGLVQLPIHEILAFQAELLYSAQGAKFRSTNDALGVKNNYFLNYITLPATFQFLAGNGFMLHSGPQLGYLLNATIKDDSGYALDILESVEKVDFSWIFGSAYKSKIGLGADVRYIVGVTETNNGVFVSSTTLKNRVFQIGLFYQFGKPGAR